MYIYFFKLIIGGSNLIFLVDWIYDNIVDGFFVGVCLYLISLGLLLLIILKKIDFCKNVVDYYDIKFIINLFFFSLVGEFLNNF